MAATISELIIRVFLKDYTVGQCIFIAELFFVASYMLYYTIKFTKIVDEVKKTLGIDFVDEKNQLKCSLGVFLTAYFLRSIIKAITLIMNREY